LGNNIKNILENALYIIATPIGNLEDITLRAIDVLKNVDVIGAEDTRNTSILLDKYNIKTHLISYHKFSETQKADVFISYLKEGKSVALVSDAGTPLISDPGEILVKKVSSEGFKVIPIPGACAVITLLSAIPREKEDFKFIGFIPRAKNQIIETVSENRFENLIFYESPMRLLDTLETISSVYPDKKIAVGRELTKKFEEIKVGTIKEILDYFKTNTLKGELVILLYSDTKAEDINVEDKIKKLKTLKLKDKEISQIISALFNVNKNIVYKKCLEVD